MANSDYAVPLGVECAWPRWSVSLSALPKPQIQVRVVVLLRRLFG
jgi:hypothetical protein